MDIIMIILIGLGLAFEVLSVSVSQGSVLGDVKGRRIVLMCLMVCAWQVVALSIGYWLATLFNIEEFSPEIQMIWKLFAGIILIGLGGIKLFLIYFKKAVPEVRSDIDFKKICGIASYTSIFTLFAGFAGGMMLLNALYLGIMICATTLGIVVIGVFVGYRNGELDKRIYWTGGVLLIIAGILAIMEYVGWLVS